jgi:hypothetical protein
MATKAKAPTRPATPPPEEEPQAMPWQTPPWTTEERLQCIAALGQRIDKYVQDMCKVGRLGGTSAEAKDKAVAAFYERMVVLERQLARIQEELRLG